MSLLDYYSEEQKIKTKVLVDGKETVKEVKAKQLREAGSRLPNVYSDEYCLNLVATNPWIFDIRWWPNGRITKKYVEKCFETRKWRTNAGHFQWAMERRDGTMTFEQFWKAFKKAMPNAFRTFITYAQGSIKQAEELKRLYPKISYEDRITYAKEEIVAYSKLLSGEQTDLKTNERFRLARFLNPNFWVKNMELDKTTLTLSDKGIRLFPSVFTMMYEAFNEGKEKLTVRSSMAVPYGKTGAVKSAMEESAGLFELSYYNVKRIICNLNLAGFVRVVRIKPPRPADWEKGDRVYSYLEVTPTDKGFKAAEKGDLCDTAEGKIGIGKGYPGYDYLKKKYFDPAKEQYHVAMTRFYDWEKAFKEYFAEELASLTEEEAVPKIEEYIVSQLVPTLPKGARGLKVAKVQEELKHTMKLDVFA